MACSDSFSVHLNKTVDIAFSPDIRNLRDKYGAIEDTRSSKIHHNTRTSHFSSEDYYCVWEEAQKNNKVSCLGDYFQKTTQELLSRLSMNTLTENEKATIVSFLCDCGAIQMKVTRASSSNTPQQLNSKDVTNVSSENTTQCSVSMGTRESEPIRDPVEDHMTTTNQSDESNLGEVVVKIENDDAPSASENSATNMEDNRTEHLQISPDYVESHNVTEEYNANDIKFVESISFPAENSEQTCIVETVEGSTIIHTNQVKGQVNTDQSSFVTGDLKTPHVEVPDIWNEPSTSGVQNNYGGEQSRSQVRHKTHTLLKNRIQLPYSVRKNIIQRTGGMRMIKRAQYLTRPTQEPGVQHNVNVTGSGNDSTVNKRSKFSVDSISKCKNCGKFLCVCYRNANVSSQTGNQSSPYQQIEQTSSQASTMTSTIQPNVVQYEQQQFGFRQGVEPPGQQHQGVPPHEPQKDKLFICYQCGKTFSTIGHLSVHTRTHKQRRNTNQQEGAKTITSVGTSQQGFLTKFHYAVKTHKCDTCGKAFSTLATLRRHMKIHAGIKAHVCQICGKSYREKLSLTIHWRTHTKEKPYKCRICDKSFSDKSNLSRHVKMHNKQTLQYFSQKV